MIDSEESTSQNEPSTNSGGESPKRPFRLTMEVPMFFVMMNFSLTGAAISNIVLYRTCVHALDYPVDKCKVFLSLDKTNQTKQLEDEVQEYATIVNTFKSVIESIAPAVLSLFLGVWSDKHGRKPLIVWPLFGIAMSGILIVIYGMLDNLGPWWYILTLMPYSLTGGMTIIFTGAFCYINDISSTESRSLRMTVFEAAVSAAVVVGGLSSAHVIRAVGNVYLLLIGATLNVMAYAYASIFITESLPGAVQGGLRSVLNCRHVKEMLRDCFKRRPNHGRAQILLLALANSLTIFIMYGTMQLEYLYLREKLNWALKDYTLFSAVSTTISFAGGFLGVIVVQKVLNISDLAFVNIAFVSTIAEYVVRVFAVQTWHMYLGAGISLFRELSSPLIRSLLTKILPFEDITKVFALMSAIEGLGPLIAPLMYNSLYKCTIITFPAAIYVLSCGITTACCVFVGFVQYYRWKIPSPYDRLEEEETTT